MRVRKTANNSQAPSVHRLYFPGRSQLPLQGTSLLLAFDFRSALLFLLRIDCPSALSERRSENVRESPSHRDDIAWLTISLAGKTGWPASLKMVMRTLGWTPDLSCASAFLSGFAPIPSHPTN